MDRNNTLYQYSFSQMNVQKYQSLTTSVRAGNIITSLLYVEKLGAQKGFVITQSHTQPCHILMFSSLRIKCNARAISVAMYLCMAQFKRDPEHNLMVYKSSASSPDRNSLTP